MTSPIRQNSQMTMTWYNYKINNLKITFYTSVSSQILNKIVGVLKNCSNFTGKHQCQVKGVRKSLTLFMQPAFSL